MAKKDTIDQNALLDPKKLSKLVSYAFDRTNNTREFRARALAFYAGAYFRRLLPADREERKSTPINMIYSGVTALLPNLVFQSPRLTVKTDVVAYRQYADLMELALNVLVKRINLTGTLRKVCLDSLFMAGFVKTGIGSSAEFVSIDEDEDMQVGQPYVMRVDPDDMILDPMARDWDEQVMVGNRFRATEEELLESGLYDEDLIKGLPLTYSSTNKNGSVEALQTLDVQQQIDGSIESYHDLIEVYLPKQKLLVTMPFTQNATHDEFLRVAEYDGPARGPYHMLGYSSLSQHVLPVAPVGIWYDMATAGSRIARKMMRQAERNKRVLAYTGEVVEDAAKLAEADDGESVFVADVNQIKEVTYGGTGAESYQWMDYVKKQFSDIAGNIDLLSGQGTNTPTATQAELQSANTSVRLADMQRQVYNFVEEIVGDLAFYLHTDPLIHMPLTKEAVHFDVLTGGVNRELTQVALTGGEQEGEWLDYNLKVQPYSMARPDPNAQLQSTMQYFTNVLPAIAQAAQLLGPSFNADVALRTMAEKLGIEEANEFMNGPAFQAWQQWRASLETGNPGQAGAGTPPPPMGIPAGQPGQPVPQAMGPSNPGPHLQQNKARQAHAPQPAARGPKLPKQSVNQQANTASQQGGPA
jgi:hypothetical protein